jgi:hypothetical protein
MGNPIAERLAWTQAAPTPGGLYFAERGPCRFEISRTADTRHLLQMRQLRPEDWPLLVWEMDGYACRKPRTKQSAWPTSTFRIS